MSEENPIVEDEIEDHATSINMWLVAMETLNIPTSKKGVVERFMRDCNILLNDLYSKDTVQASDLVDFADRKASLEIQYINITNSLK